MHLETLLASNTPILRMDTYFIHSVLSHHLIDNHSSINTEQEEEKQFESPLFLSKSLEYQNILDIKVRHLILQLTNYLIKLNKAIKVYLMI